jgi:predicted GNAT superfamily acetyltransferase
VILRDATLEDLPSVWRLNDAAVPAVSRIPPSALERLWRQAIYSPVALSPAGDIGGFLIALGPGVAYDSPNYRWFSSRYADFVYIDRVVVDDACQHQGLGSRMYARAWELAVRHGGILLCEVNLRPRNDMSLAFHDKLGFRSVGRQDTDEGTKTVSMLLKDA